MWESCQLPPEFFVFQIGIRGYPFQVEKLSATADFLFVCVFQNVVWGPPDPSGKVVSYFFDQTASCSDHIK